MTEITVQFCAFDSLMGTAIRWFTQGAVGHVDAVLPTGELLGAQDADGLGGRPSGVQIRPPDYGGMRFKMRATFQVTDAHAHAFYDFLQAQVGKPYDVTAIEAFIAGRDWHDDKAWFCSELQAAALERAGVFPQPLVSPANKITPAALMLVCSALVKVATA
jgi:hypothetical protein